jgi:alpha-L-glutamate ligase-like protein
MRSLRQLFSASPNVVGINRRNVELVYAHNARRDYRFADDKLLSKQLLRAAGVATPETLVLCDGLHAVAPALTALSARTQFVVKPASSSGGQGILVIGERLADDSGFVRASGAPLSDDALRAHLASIVFGAFSADTGDVAYAEQRVVAHPLLDALWPHGLCDVRVLTLNAKPLMAMLRVPTLRSDGRANLHQGALGLALALDSGEVFRALCRGRAIEAHPDSGRAFLGLRIPGWSAVLDAATRAARAIPLGYLGIDIVLDRAGEPLVLEVNARPGLEIQNVNGRGLGAALAQLEAGA